MKRILLGVCAGLLAAAASARADATSKMKKIDEVFELTRADQMLKMMQEQAKAGIRSQLAAVGMKNAQAIATELDRVLVPLMNQEMSWDKLKPRLEAVYDETFSEQEISGILDFYHSPTGKAMLDKMPALTAKSAAIAQDMMRAVMPKFMEAMPGIMERIDKQYPDSSEPAASPKAK